MTDPIKLAIVEFEWILALLKEQLECCDLTEGEVGRIEHAVKTVREALQSVIESQSEIERLKHELTLQSNANSRYKQRINEMILKAQERNQEIQTLRNMVATDEADLDHHLAAIRALGYDVTIGVR
jgi:DNA repair exonuclease SbcCD ATPase subunit